MNPNSVFHSLYHGRGFRENLGQPLLLKMKKLRSDRGYVLAKIIESFLHSFTQQGFTEQLLSEGEHSELKSNRDVGPDHRDLGRPSYGVRIPF